MCHLNFSWTCSWICSEESIRLNWMQGTRTPSSLIACPCVQHQEEKSAERPGWLLWRATRQRPHGSSTRIAVDSQHLQFEVRPWQSLSRHVSPGMTDSPYEKMMKCFCNAFDYSWLTLKLNAYHIVPIYVRRSQTHLHKYTMINNDKRKHKLIFMIIHYKWMQDCHWSLDT